MGTEISNEDLYKLLKQIIDQNSEIKEDIKTIKGEISENKAYIEELKKKVCSLEKENQNIKQTVKTLEKKSKRNNIIIFGIEENENEDTINEAVTNINRKLNLSLEKTDINNGFRIGKKVENKIRPIILELLRGHTKYTILNNCHKLKGQNISIARDLIKEELQEQKTLRNHLKEAKENKQTAKIVGNKLELNGKLYTINELKTISYTQNQDKENIVKPSNDYTQTESASKSRLYINTRNASRKLGQTTSK